MADEGADVRYAILAHRKESLTVAETEDFVAKQLKGIKCVRPNPDDKYSAYAAILSPRQRARG